MRFYFCPACGTAVYWEAEYLPDDIGVAVGAFVDRYYLRRRYPSGRNLAIRGSSSGMISGTFHNSQPQPSPLADLSGSSAPPGRAEIGFAVPRYGARDAAFHLSHLLTYLSAGSSRVGLDDHTPGRQFVALTTPPRQ